MRDLDRGPSGHEDYNPEREGKPEDSTRREQTPGGMQGAGDRERSGDRGVRDPRRERDELDPALGRPGRSDDELNDEDSASEQGKTRRDTDENMQGKNRNR
jgi:hypothetical protein